MSRKLMPLIALPLALCLTAGCGSLTPEEARAELEKRQIGFDQDGIAGAVMASDTELVELFIAAGYDPNEFDKPRSAPLMLSTRRSHAPTMKKLIEAGARADGLPGILNTGASRGDLQSMALLIEAGADVNAADGVGVTALLAAIGAQDPRSVEFLLEHGAKTDDGTPQRGRRRKIPLIEAVKLAQPEIVAMLLEAGADVHRNGGTPIETPLIAAARLGLTEIAELLLEAGADAQEEVQGMNAVDAARRRGHETLAEHLEAAAAAP